MTTVVTGFRVVEKISDTKSKPLSRKYMSKSAAEFYLQCLQRMAPKTQAYIQEVYGSDDLPQGF